MTAEAEAKAKTPTCKKGHGRLEHGYVSKSGEVRCRTCRAEFALQQRLKAAEVKAAEAAKIAARRSAAGLDAPRAKPIAADRLWSPDFAEDVRRKDRFRASLGQDVLAAIRGRKRQQTP